LVHFLVWIFISSAVASQTAASLSLNDIIDKNTGIENSTAKDETIARLLVETNSKLFSAKPNWGNIFKLQSLLKHNDEWQEYSFYVDILIKLNKANNIAQNIELCNEISLYSKNNHELEKLIKDSQNYCIQKFLQQNPKSFNSKESFAFIDNNIGNILDSKNQTELRGFLKKIKSNSELYNKVTDTIITHSQNNHTTLSADVIAALAQTARLTKHIQSNLYFQKESQLQLSTLLKEYTNSIIDDYDKNKKIDKDTFQGVLHFVENNLENLDHQLAAERLYYFTKALVRRDLTIEVDKVIPLFLKIKDNNYNELIVFERLWLDWVKGDYKSAYNLIKKQNLISRIPEISDSKLKFWLIWTLIKLKNKNGFALANGFVLDNPLSYYSIILHNFNPDTVNSPFRIIQANKALNLVTPFTELPIKLQNQLRRYSVFSKLGNLTFMSLETDNMFKNFDSRFHSDIYAYQIWSHVNHKNNLEVFKTVSNALKSNNITLNQGVLKLIFPLSYLETIKVYNKKVDPYLILSLIRQESVFNPQAVSRVGALGLMQLMPTTAKRYEKDVSRNNLFKPNQNIRIGSKYFEGLMKMFNDNAILSLAAYNAGEGRVKRWLTEYFNTDSMLETIEQIPFSETQGYVKLISRNLYFYKSLYQDKEIELAAKREDKNSIYDVAMWTTTIR